MPQVKAADFGRMLQLFEEAGVSYERTKENVGKLKASQKDIVRKFLEGDKPLDLKTLKPLVISNDDYIVDGHHRWLEIKARNGDDVEANVIRLDIPKDEAIEKLKEIQQEIEDEKTKSGEFGVSAEIVGLKKQREEWNQQARQILDSKGDDEMTDEDKAILAKYSGDGGTSEVSLNEFYTSKEVAGWMWKMMEKFGFNGGSVLEPSCSTGVFIHTKPEDTLVTGVEISDVSARIARILHPNDMIENMPFEQYAKENADEKFDAVIGNIPFGVRGASRGIHKPKIGTFEEYFMDTLFDHLHEGGTMGMIVPTGFLDNKTFRELRKKISEQAQFLGAFRLPNTAFKHSGTTVTTDVVFFRKHPEAVQQKILELKADPANHAALDEAGIYDESFVNGGYYEGEGAKHIWGEKDTGRWGAMIVKGKIGEAQMKEALDEEAPNQPSYEKLVEGAANVERKHQVGDVIFVNGRQYRLNENHRWERVGDGEEDRQRKLNVDFQTFGVGDRSEFQQTISDRAKLIRLDSKQRRVAADYLDVVETEDFPEADDLRERVSNAMNASAEAPTEHDAAKLYQASLIGSYIAQLQEEAQRGHLPDYRHFEQLVLLMEDYRKEFGNPVKDNLVVQAGGSDKGIQKFLGGFKDDGSTSDFMQNPEAFVRTEAMRAGYDPDNIGSVLKHFDQKGIKGDLATIARFYNWAKGKSDDELEAVLLQWDDVAYSDGQYFPMERALSGSVYDKLDGWQAQVAKLQSGNDPHKDLKIDKLQKQIGLLRGKATFRKIEDMPILFTSRWIPLKYLNQYLHDEQDWKGISFDPDRNRYDVDPTTFGKELPTAHNEYGDFLNYVNGEGLTHGTQNENRMAALKEMEQQFKSWLAVHPDRDKIEDQFNRSFNNYLNETFDDSPIAIDKKSDSFDLNPYHYSAIKRLLSKGRGILAYGTGLGKTFAGLATALLLKQTGKAKKPMVVVPKSVFANWQEEIKRFVGEKSINLMVIGQHERKKNGLVQNDKNGNPIWDDDTFEQVQAKLQQVAQNDYDLVLVTRDKLDMVGLSKDTMESYLHQIINKHITRGDLSDREFKEAVERMEGQIMGRARGGHEKTQFVNFDELGVDALFVDEAHNYRNLFGLLGRQQNTMWALSQPDTQRSMRMYLFSKWVREHNTPENRNVFLLTATPTVNNPLEAFNMLQYIAPEELDKRNLPTISEFFDMFGRVEPVNVMRANGQMEERMGLVGFQSLPELRQMFLEYTDMRRAKDVGLKVPEEAAEFKLSDFTPTQRRVYDELRQRADALFDAKAKGQDTEDHLFSIFSDMQKATVSLRLLQQTGSKLAPVVTNAEVETEGMSPKMRQCVEHTIDFHKQGKKKIIFAEYKELQTELRDQLVKAGIPKEEIVIVNADTAKSARDRQRISDEYNKGKYTVVIGNKTMQEGMNFQRGTGAIDHLMLAWTPADLEQRNGRGVRQGNKVDSVAVSYYLTKGSFDHFLHEAVNRKRGWQWDLWHSQDESVENKNTGRSFSPQELRVMLSEDPEAERIRAAEMEKSAVEKQVDGYKSRALSSFNQYQNLLIQYGKMSPEEKEAERGRDVKTRIDVARSGLQRDKYFEQKGLLEGNEPAYVDSDKRILMPVGRYFTANDGDWKKHGLYQFVKVDPVKREVIVRKVTPSEGESEYSYYRGIPNRMGEVRSVDYKEFREHFKQGIQAASPDHGELQNLVVERMKQFKDVTLLAPETLAARKAEILEKLSEGDSDQIVPYVNQDTGKVEFAELSDFVYPKEFLKHSKDEEAAGEEKGYWMEHHRKWMKTERKPVESIYFPTDPERFKKDILAQAQKDVEGWEKEYKRWKDMYGRKRGRSWRPSMPERSAAMKMADAMFGRYGNWEDQEIEEGETGDQESVETEQENEE